MRQIILAVVCLTLLATPTVSRADYSEEFDGPFQIEGTSYSIHRHKRYPFCFINASFVNGAELAIFSISGKLVAVVHSRRRQRLDIVGGVRED